MMQLSWAEIIACAKLVQPTLQLFFGFVVVVGTHFIQEKGSVVGGIVCRRLETRHDKAKCLSQS